jgi:hypothetical protein
VALPDAVTPEPDPDLRKEINNLKGMIIEMEKNQRPTTTTINQNNNSINNTNYINIFLNDKYHNACDIRRFIAVIDLPK